MDATNDPRHNFDAGPSLDEIIAQQGKGPINDLSVLHGDFWPEEESIQDFSNRGDYLGVPGLKLISHE